MQMSLLRPIRSPVQGTAMLALALAVTPTAPAQYALESATAGHLATITSAGDGFAVDGMLGATVLSWGGSADGFVMEPGSGSLGWPDEQDATPELWIVQDAPGSLRVRWRPVVAGYVLQHSPGLTPAAWTDVPVNPGQEADVPAAVAGFYRLLRR